MRRILVLCLLGATLATTATSAAEMSKKTVPASGQAAFSCAGTTELHSRMLYNNSGTYGSSASVPGQTVDLFCGYAAEAGTFYADVWGYIPYGNFQDGGEVDFRAGWSRQFGQVGIDLSAALYNFRILGVGTYNTVDLRGKLSYNFLAPSNPVVLQVYGILDYTRSLDSLPESFAVAGGVYAGYKLTAAFDIGLTAEVWQQTMSPATIVSLGPKAAYRWSKSGEIYIKALYTNGSVVQNDPEPNKWDFVVGTSYKF